MRMPFFLLIASVLLSTSVAMAEPTAPTESTTPLVVGVTIAPLEAEVHAARAAVMSRAVVMGRRWWRGRADRGRADGTRTGPWGRLRFGLRRGAVGPMRRRPGASSTVEDLGLASRMQGNSRPRATEGSGPGRGAAVTQAAKLRARARRPVAKTRPEPSGPVDALARGVFASTSPRTGTLGRPAVTSTPGVLAGRTAVVKPEVAPVGPTREGAEPTKVGVLVEPAVVPSETVAVAAESVLAGRAVVPSEVVPLSAEVRIVQLPKPAGFDYRAGQHVKLSMGGVAKARSYSIASSPHDPHLEFCIEHVPGGQLTPKLFASGSSAGLQLASAAKGSFGLDSGAARHLMVATVTGIAPLRSMLRDALHRGVQADFIVLHGASHADELPYRAELEALAAANERVTYIPTVSRPEEARNQGWAGRTGRVDPLAMEIAGTLRSDATHTRVYACGNSGMVARVRQELGSAGFAVSTEAFGG